MESSLLKDHEDHIAENVFNSMRYYNLVHKFLPMPQATKIPDAKAAVSSKKNARKKCTNVRSKKKVILEAHDEKKEVHFAALMDICHLNNAELEPKYQKYRGRIVLRGDTAKDDSGSCAVFAELGSSASEMTAPKGVDVIARLPGRAGRAADAISAHTQVKMEDAPKLFKISKSECQDVLLRVPRHKQMA